MASNLFMLWVTLASILVRVASIDTSTVTDVLLLCPSETISAIQQVAVSGCVGLSSSTVPAPQTSLTILQISTYSTTIFWTLTTPLSTLSPSMSYTSGMRYFVFAQSYVCGRAAMGYRCATVESLFAMVDIYETYYIPSGVNVVQSVTEAVTKSVCLGQDGTYTVYTTGPTTGESTSIYCPNSQYLKS